MRQEISVAVRGKTLVGHLLDSIEKRGDETALRWLETDGWQEMSWRRYVDLASRFAGSLSTLGLTRGRRALLMLRNRPEFHVIDAGVTLAGGVPISVFNGSSSDQARYLARHSGASVAIVDDEAWAEYFLEGGRPIPPLSHVIVARGSAVVKGAERYQDLRAGEPIDLERARAETGAEDLLTVCYTSGTTGRPKGVMISHRAVCWWIESSSRGFAPRTIESAISYLPMTTMLERLVSHYAPMALGSRVTPCPDSSSIGTYLREVRPQFFAGVPLVWERMRTVLQSAAASDPSRAEAFSRAVELGRRLGSLHSQGRSGDFQLEDEYNRLDAELLRDLRALVGLDRCSLAVIGAAPIPPDLAEFFLAIGVPLSGSYGLTECTGIVNQFGARLPGYVGHPSPGCELRLADDDEILVRTGCMFSGYLDDPEATASVLDSEGWLHTGDVGHIDPRGGLRIVDRKKELIVRPSGRNVSPAMLESTLTGDPLVDHACVFGDGRSRLGSLLVLNEESVRSRVGRDGLEELPAPDLARHPETVELAARVVDQVNRRVSDEEQIEVFGTLIERWGPDSGELTPTLKLKRSVVLDRYADLIESLYADSGSDELEPQQRDSTESEASRVARSYVEAPARR